MARNRYPGYCYRCGKWCEPGAAHFEKYGHHWRVHCIECAKANQQRKKELRRLRREEKLNGNQD